MKKLFCIILLFLLLTANVGQAQFVSIGTFGQLPNLGHWATDGLVFYWRGIQDKKVRDESYYGNHGTITGATWVGEGLLFDGSDPSTSYVTLPAISLLGKDITISAIIKSVDTATPGVQWIYKQWGDPISDGPALFSAGTLLRWQVGAYADRLDVANVIVQDTWQHIVSTKQGTTLSVYIDGVLVGSGVRTITHTSNQTAYISGNSESGVEAFNGRIRNVSVYNRALSASEIAELYINPDLPMFDQPIWLFYSPTVGVVHRPAIGYGIGIGIGR